MVDGGVIPADFCCFKRTLIASWCLPANAGDVRDTGLIPGSRRSPGGGHGNLLQYCCLENLTDREHWLATVHRVTESQTRLKQLSMHTFVYLATPHLSCGTWDLQSSLQHVGSSSLTRNQTQSSCTGSGES